ncbi:MAG: GNAT family N-acetyltransferase, partial [Verrucomicrobia bacterium]|nr:GNAT family N-acetyltransferase [Verrucomicrobiota bacterium]
VISPWNEQTQTAAETKSEDRKGQVMNQEITIRQAQESDKNRIREIAGLAWHGQGAGWFLQQKYGLIGGKTYIDWMWPSIEIKFKTMPQWVLVSEVGCEIAGFVCLVLFPERQTARIGYNAVDPKFRGMGLGKKQITHIMDIFYREKMKFAEVVVDQDEGHTAARKVYGSFGFEPTVILEMRYGEVSKVPPPQSTGNLKFRPAVDADAPFVKDALATAQKGWHKYSVVEARYGIVGGRSWVEWMWQDCQNELKGDWSRVLIVEKGGQRAGALVYGLSHDNQMGQVQSISLLPSVKNNEIIPTCIGGIADIFRQKNVPYWELDSLLTTDGARQIPVEVCKNCGLEDNAVVARGEYRFRQL